MWISKKTYQLMVELKQAAEQKARFFEQLNIQVTRENRRLIERLLAKNNIPMAESPENLIQNVVKGVEQEYAEQGGDIFEDDDMGEPVIRDAKDEARREQESDKMEMQP
jgi:hypothetical protein